MTFYEKYFQIICRATERLLSIFMTIKCLLCEKPSSYLDDYKFNVNSDVEFFGELKIFYCDECDLAFADPMPPLSKLDYFYKYIYRDIGRPHYTNPVSYTHLTLPTSDLV